jgi:hypothetical protein
MLPPLEINLLNGSIFTLKEALRRSFSVTQLAVDFAPRREFNAIAEAWDPRKVVSVELLLRSPRSTDRDEVLGPNMPTPWRSLLCVDVENLTDFARPQAGHEIKSLPGLAARALGLVRTRNEPNRDALFKDRIPIVAVREPL